MTAADVSALRAKACDLVSTLGHVLDELAIAEQAIATPSKDRRMDAAVIAGRIANAAEGVAQLVDQVHVFSLALDPHVPKGGES